MRPIIASILLFLFPATLYAEQVLLYRGEAPVADKERPARQAAVPLALENSLSKITGMRDLSSVPGVSDALKRASGMMISYYYQSRPQTLPDGTTIDELRLVAEFAPSRVDELVRELQLPIWQAERDPIEIWVVIDDAGTRQVLPEAWRNAWQPMAYVAEDRGLPLTWPQADEEGMFPVDMQLLWGGYTEDLMGDGGAGVMIVSARREGAVWNVRSNLQNRDQTWAWRSQDYDLQQILFESMQLAVDQLAAANAIAAADRELSSYELTVTGLGRGSDYQGCLGQLAGISVVDAVRVASAQAGRFRFKLSLNAMPRFLEEALEASRQFEAAEQPGEYRYVP